MNKREQSRYTICSATTKVMIGPAKLFWSSYKCTMPSTLYLHLIQNRQAVETKALFSCRWDGKQVARKIAHEMAMDKINWYVHLVNARSSHSS